MKENSCKPHLNDRHTYYRWSQQINQEKTLMNC